MCCRRKQQGGSGFLVCESWVAHRVEASEDVVVSCFSEFLNLSCFLF